MGGKGSGLKRGETPKPTVDGRKNLKIEHLFDRGYLRPGRAFDWRWNAAKGMRANLQCRVADEGEALQLTYRPENWPADCDELTLSYRLAIVWGRCLFGGAKPYFVCPGADCGRRVTKLYEWGWVFLCRNCQGFTYQSRRETREQRMARRARRARRELGGPVRLDAPLPDRPRGMHLRTYLRLLADIEAYQLPPRRSA